MPYKRTYLPRRKSQGTWVVLFFLSKFLSSWFSSLYNLHSHRHNEKFIFFLKLLRVEILCQCTYMYTVLVFTLSVDSPWAWSDQCKFQSQVKSLVSLMIDEDNFFYFLFQELIFQPTDRFQQLFIHFWEHQNTLTNWR